MLLTIENAIIFYQKILKKSIKTGAKVIIFVATETDALCASKILTALLKSDNIQYILVPVLSFSQLEKEFDALKTKENVKSLVFLNCGAQLDLTEKWFSSPDSKIKCYLFDSHRPVHHNNVNSHNKVIVIDDMVSKLSECPLPEDIIGAVSDEDEDEENELENEEEIPETEEKKEEEKKEGENNNENPQAEIGNKRKTMEERAEARKIRRFRKAKIEAYYSGSFYGKSVAQLMYNIAQQANKENADMLWYAILGVTYQFIHSRISKLQYDDAVIELQRELSHMIRSKDAPKTTLETIDEENKEKGKIISSSNTDVGVITGQQELLFMLLRHWNLYDSAYYSNYIASKLSIWKEQGKRELSKFFALLGISLEEAKQQYKHMKPEHRKNLTERVMDVANQLKLTDIAFNSFVRQYDRKTQYSASDIVYCITSILECPRKAIKLSAAGVVESVMSREDQKENLGEESKENPGVDLFSDDILKENFWAAYDALGDSHYEIIKQGIELAIEMQTAIVNQGTTLIEKKSILPAQELRYAIMYNDNLQEVKFFQYPLALQKLALFVMDAYKESKKSAKDKPLVLCVLNSKTNIFLVVGVTGMQGMSEVPKNTFGIRFRKAAEGANARVKHDGFETSIIEILKDDFEGFIDELCIKKKTDK